jgi:AcrR family transcriptional regulator
MSGKGRADHDGAASTSITLGHDGLSAPGASGNGGAREGGNIAEMQRRRLLLAIGEVVATDGLEDASVGRVCKHAGMSRRTFYELFEDREACFLAAVELTVDRIAQSVIAAYTHGAPAPGAGGALRSPGWRERVRAALAVILERFDSEPALARVCVLETLKAGPRALEYRQRVLNGLSKAIDQGRLEKKNVTGPVPLTAESTVGGVLAILHARVLVRDPRPLIELLNPLMSMIVHPYLGVAAARRELEMPVAQSHANLVGSVVVNGGGADPFRDLQIRFTYRTARVMSAIASEPGINNREVGEAAGVHDQGQMSKLLRRLQRNGLVDNHRSEQARGEPNAWTLTERGRAIHTAIDTHADA